MGVRIKNIDSAIELSGYSGMFRDSLREVLKLIRKDNRIKTVNQAAFLLATAKVESGYSLSRWEADYLCGSIGVPFSARPCQKALDYYASTKGKQNYYNLGVDPYGLPYFGRGLIQLTGKSNYETYGSIIGADLVSNPNLAMEPKNSYNIAVEYMNRRKLNGKTAFEWADEGNLVNAKKIIGGTGTLDSTTKAYETWRDILIKSGTGHNYTTLVGTAFIPDKDDRTTFIAPVGMIVLAIGVILIITKLKK
jgi:predicted chitinase